LKNLLILFFVTGSMHCTGQEENPKPFQNSITISGGFGLVDLEIWFDFSVFTRIYLESSF